MYTELGAAVRAKVGMQLIPENENNADAYRIRVYGSWLQHGRWVRHHIGYVPQRLANLICMSNEDQGLLAWLSSINNNREKGFDIKIHIFSR